MHWTHCCNASIPALPGLPGLPGLLALPALPWWEMGFFAGWEMGLLGRCRLLFGKSLRNAGNFDLSTGGLRIIFVISLLCDCH